MKPNKRKRMLIIDGGLYNESETPKWLAKDGSGCIFTYFNKPHTADEGDNKHPYWLGGVGNIQSLPVLKILIDEMIPQRVVAMSGVRTVVLDDPDDVDSLPLLMLAEDEFDVGIELEFTSDMDVYNNKWDWMYD